MSQHRTPAEEPAHDVLAAEAFADAGAGPELRHGPVCCPRIRAGSPEPHDVLAAEEFAMPAPEATLAPAPPRARGSAAGSRSPRRRRSRVC